MKIILVLGMALFIVAVTLFVGKTTFEGWRIVKVERPLLALLTFGVLLFFWFRGK